MLDAMRRGALNWVAKILLGILVVAFAVWGIGDTVRTVGRGSVATIGKTKISEEDFRQAYQEEMSSISRRLGRRPDERRPEIAADENFLAAGLDHFTDQRRGRALAVGAGDRHQGRREKSIR